MRSNPQTRKFLLTTGAVGYITRPDQTATPAQYLTAGSQNVLINEATDKEGDKVESRAGYTLKGAEDDSGNRYGIVSEFTFKTKAGETMMGRMNSNGVFEFYSETSSAWETLLTGLNGSFPLRSDSVWDPSNLIRRLLLVNHSTTLYDWTGATGTLASVDDTTHLSLNETIGTRGFLGSSGSIRIKDSGGTWRTFSVTGSSNKQFTVTEDPTAYTFDDDAIVVQAVSTHATTPDSGFTNDVIKVLDNHVYLGSHSSSIVYMSDSTDYTDFTFSSPRLATEGWQFVLDDFCVGFATNISGSGEESLVIFAGDDWIYRVQFVDLADSSSIAQIAQIKPIVVSSGQGALSQELVAKVGNSIIYLNAFNELVDLGNVENLSTPELVPISDPIKPDFLAADFTGGSLRFWRNNLYCAAKASGLLFILAFRSDQNGVRRFWQPPQTLPIGCTSDYDGDLIGHSAALTESYKLFDGTNDNGRPISFKAYFAYNNFGARDKLKNFQHYFVELYLTSNTALRLILVFEYLASKSMPTYEFFGTSADYLFTPNPNASLGVQSLGTSPLGTYPSEVPNFLKYRRFKKTVHTDFFEMQARFEADDLDAQFQILCHGPDAVLSRNALPRLIN